MATVIDEKPAVPAWAILADIKERNANNVELFDNNAVDLAKRIETVASWVFPHNQIYVNYRKHFIAVKVADASMIDANPANAVKLLGMCEEANISMAPVGPHLIFRIPR